MAPDSLGNATAAGSVSGPDGPAAPSDSKHGRVLTVTVAGPASKLTMPMYVYLPPGYNAGASLRYPVIDALHGYPGVAAQWLHALAAPEILDAEITARRMAPAVVLFPYQSPKPLQLDTECTNLVGSAQSETFLTQDVPAYARSHFRVRTDQSGWSLIGFSAGAYCATDRLVVDLARAAHDLPPTGGLTPEPGRTSSAGARVRNASTRPREFFCVTHTARSTVGPMDAIQPAQAYDIAACGRAIAKARLAAGLTLDELAARSGVSRRHLVDLEHGNNGPSTRVLYAISLGLGVDGADLFRQGFPAATPSAA